MFFILVKCVVSPSVLLGFQLPHLRSFFLLSPNLGNRPLPTYILYLFQKQIICTNKKLRIKVPLEKEVRRLALCKNSLK